jgi:predicted ATP-dependent endonuclease of OLD family
MELTKIYFDAYKSLLKKELEKTENCIGIVGKNESGKSNVLEAINILSGNKQLSLSDTPRMSETNSPKLRFEFKPTNEEKEKIKALIHDWSEKNTLIGKNIKISDITIFYNIEFEKKIKQEKRYFTIKGITLDSDCYFLLPKHLNDHYKINHDKIFVPLSNAIIVKEKSFEIDEQHNSIYHSLEDLNFKISTLQEEIRQFNEISLTEVANEIIKNINEPTTAEKAEENEKTKSQSERKSQNEILKKEKDLSQKLQERIRFEKSINDFNTDLIKKSLSDEIGNLDTELKKAKSDFDANNESISKLGKPDTIVEEAQKLELVTFNLNAKTLSARIAKLEKEIDTKTKILGSLNTPLREKYTKNFNEFNNYLNNIMNSYLENCLPKVVFWENSKDFILQSETLFSDILSKNDLSEISRPLVNIFRICLNINTIEDIKTQINDIQNITYNRSKVNDILNEKINEYIKSVWTEYDQQIKISLEEKRIRIEIYDPEYKNRSYYSMEERSQGCKAFLSFLLTIGAEAKHGVIKDTILLLDEPETHLHPTGVRFMLEELIKISEKGNLVIYATHSIFMIDRNNYNRHIILKKKKEQTIIEPSLRDRVGYFIQEEVLYMALDINLNKDFTSTNKDNFVFEGNGDAILFQHYYNKILDEASRPFSSKNTSFYQGGKCTDIKKYFSQRPIQLGTKWVFILDSDEPANELKKFLEDKYKEYINIEIFIFQYTTNIAKNIELEDLLSPELIDDVIISTYDQLEVKTGKEFKNIRKPKDTFDEIKSKVTELYKKKEDFIPLFKENLNDTIHSKLGTKEKFIEDFPKYYNWCEKTTALIKNLINKSSN